MPGGSQVQILDPFGFPWGFVLRGAGVSIFEKYTGVVGNAYTSRPFKALLTCRCRRASRRAPIGARRPPDTGSPWT